MPTRHATPPDHVHWMRLALRQARQAAQAGEVPVGAVLVRHGELVAQAHNQTLGLQDPTAHAEVLALRAAAQTLGNHRLHDCTLYVTLEPCSMCSGAVFQARLAQLVYGAAEPKMGAAGSVVNLYAVRALNHHTRIEGGVLERECAAILAEFFARQRSLQKTQQTATGLRDDALRTPAQPFTQIDAPEGQYRNDLPALHGLRMHWLDNAAALLPDKALADATLVGLPPVWHWSAYWQPVLDAGARAGLRCLAPDLPGWGRSDKPKKTAWHSPQKHLEVLQQWLAPLDLQHVVLLAPSPRMPLAAALAQASCTRIAGVLAIEGRGFAATDHALTADTRAWLQTVAHMRGPLDWAAQMQRHVPQLPRGDALLLGAPFPDAGHAAALKYTARQALTAQNPQGDAQRLAWLRIADTDNASPTPETARNIVEAALQASAGWQPQAGKASSGV